MHRLNRWYKISINIQDEMNADKYDTKLKISFYILEDRTYSDFWTLQTEEVWLTAKAKGYLVGTSKYAKVFKARAKTDEYFLTY